MNEPYITDFGENLKMRASDGTESELERYGVWTFSGGRRYEVEEVGNDLSYLMKKYGVPAARIHLLRGPLASPGEPSGLEPLPSSAG